MMRIEAPSCILYPPDPRTNVKASPIYRLIRAVWGYTRTSCNVNHNFYENPCRKVHNTHSVIFESSVKARCDPVNFEQPDKQMKRV
ncbi:hypothetical protein K443DRAFT_313095 [Laccaria amethystina LaAM-08-1]|uniref:Uncharacterized protein n=1 Tax=Laccaria amethystina LaAM-08-1 TaxID=1095629 RepID=A0A0C9WK64_9AGAR|nr:hypothetical protein K443DRAFT_313095 [Laccaria amethystina LaAM-08-1]